LKNILFFTQVSVDSIYSRGLYTDLFKYFKDKGHHVIIFSPLERRNKEKSKVIEGDGFKIVRYLTPNINKVGKVEKAVVYYNGRLPHSSIDYLTPNDAHHRVGRLKKHWKYYWKEGQPQEVVELLDTYTPD